MEDADEPGEKWDAKHMANAGGEASLCPDTRALSFEEMARGNE